MISVNVLRGTRSIWSKLKNIPKKGYANYSKLLDPVKQVKNFFDPFQFFSTLPTSFDPSHSSSKKRTFWVTFLCMVFPPLLPFPLQPSCVIIQSPPPPFSPSSFPFRPVRRRYLRRLFFSPSFFPLPHRSSHDVTCVIKQLLIFCGMCGGVGSTVRIFVGIGFLELKRGSSCVLFLF